VLLVRFVEGRASRRAAALQHGPQLPAKGLVRRVVRVHQRLQPLLRQLLRQRLAAPGSGAEAGAGGERDGACKRGERDEKETSSGNRGHCCKRLRADHRPHQHVKALQVAIKPGEKLLPTHQEVGKGGGEARA